MASERSSRANTSKVGINSCLRHDLLGNSTLILSIIDLSPFIRHHARVKSDFRFHHTLRVRFGETDLQSIVFNANYLLYCDVAWTEYFRAIGLTWDEMVASGLDTVLARSTIE